MIELSVLDISGFEVCTNSLNMYIDGSHAHISDSSCYSCKNDNKNPDCESCIGYIGKYDLKAMKGLIDSVKDGFLELINVSMEIKAPIYWWNELSYFTGKVFDALYLSSHDIMEKEITLDDFSYDGLSIYDEDGEILRDFLGDLDDLIYDFNFARDKYIEIKNSSIPEVINKYGVNDFNKLDGILYEDKYNNLLKYHKNQIMKLLPISYNISSVINLNYKDLINLYRNKSKLVVSPEWETFFRSIFKLPYFVELCG